MPPCVEVALAFVGVDFAALEGGLDFLGGGVAFRHLLQVGAGGEGPARAGDDAASHRRILLEVVERVGELPQQAAPQGVEALGAIEPEDGVVLAGVLFVLKFRHGPDSLARLR